MSSTQTTADEVKQFLSVYGKSDDPRDPDIERLKNLIRKVSVDERYELLSSITDGDGDTLLTTAARKGHTELCVTLLSSLPSADRLKPILVDNYTVLHSAARMGYKGTVSGILNCLTADQQLQLLFTQNIFGDTALHKAAQRVSVRKSHT